MTLATMLVRLDERSGLYISEALPTDVKLFLANETNALDKPERLSRCPMGFTPWVLHRLPVLRLQISGASTRTIITESGRFGAILVTPFNQTRLFAERAVSIACRASGPIDCSVNALMLWWI